MEVVRRLLTMPDGRGLDVSVGGPPEWAGALLFELGFPSGRVPYPPAVTWAEAHGLRFMTFARPGYARSSRHEGRSVASTARDAADAADQLGIRRLHAVGWSAGAPFVVALGALRPDLVASVATMGGLAPLGFYASWPTEDTALRKHAEVFVENALALADALERGQPPEWGALDRAALRGPVGAFVAETIRDGLSSGAWGPHDDVLAIDRYDWGVDLAAIRVPVSIWHGLEEERVPIEHAQWLSSNVPGATLHLLGGGGTCHDRRRAPCSDPR